MTVTVANTALTNTVEYMINRVNELSDAMTTKVVSVESNTAIGNAAITGTFSANVIKVGNTTNNVAISSPNTAQISSGDYFLNANGTWSEVISDIITSGSVETSGGAAQVVDQYNASSIKAAEYYIHVRNNNANGYQISKLLNIHTGNSSVSGQSFLTEYAIITTNNYFATFSSNVVGANVVIYITPDSSNTSVNFTRIIV
jgi:hypothetical protein